MHKVCIIIPTLNESDTIINLIEKLENLKFLNRLIVIDDGSTDGTNEILKELMKKHSNIKLIERGKRLGFGSAIVNGFRSALKLTPQPDYVVTMDADLSHNPKYIPKLVETCCEKIVVVGSRYIEGGQIMNWSIYRRLLSKVANLIPRFFLKIPVHDCTSGFRCYSRKVIHCFISSLSSNGYEIQIETLFKARKQGFKIVEVPITFIGRQYGESKLGFKEIWNYVKHIHKLKRVKE